VSWIIYAAVAVWVLVVMFTIALCKAAAHADHQAEDAQRERESGDDE
jgi:hypothetical protein